MALFVTVIPYHWLAQVILIGALKHRRKDCSQPRGRWGEVGVGEARKQEPRVQPPHSFDWEEERWAEEVKGSMMLVGLGEDELREVGAGLDCFPPLPQSPAA
jgi:hypothetical protein